MSGLRGDGRRPYSVRASGAIPARITSTSAEAAIDTAMFYQHGKRANGCRIVRNPDGSFRVYTRDWQLLHRCVRVVCYARA